MNETFDIKHEIDTCGYCCPIPMVSTLKVLSRLESGDYIKVKVTDHGYAQDIRVVESNGKFTVISEEEGDDYDTFILQKT